MSDIYLNPNYAQKYMWMKFNIFYSTKYLARLRSEGGGAAYIKIGGRIFYLPSELDEWIKSRSKDLRSTSVPGRSRAAATSNGQHILAELRQEMLGCDIDVFDHLSKCNVPVATE